MPLTPVIPGGTVKSISRKATPMQRYVMKITHTPTEAYVICSDVADCMPEVRSWFDGVPPEARERTDELLDAVAHREASPEDYAELGLEVKHYRAYELIAETANTQHVIDEMSELITGLIELRNRDIRIYADIGINITDIARALGVSRNVIYKALHKTNNV